MVGVEGYFSLDHTQGHTIVGRTPLDEGSARRRNLYLTKHNTHINKHSCPLRDTNLQCQQAIGYTFSAGVIEHQAVNLVRR